MIDVLDPCSDSGLPCLDLRAHGMASEAGEIRIYPETGSPISAHVQQDWSASCYLRRLAGTATGLGEMMLYIDECGADGDFVFGQAFPQPFPTGDDLALQRAVATHRLRHRYASSTKPYLKLDVVPHRPVNLTLRIAGMQFEEGGYVSDLMLTSSGEIGAVSRQGRPAPACSQSAA